MLFDVALQLGAAVRQAVWTHGRYDPGATDAADGGNVLADAVGQLRSSGAWLLGLFCCHGDDYRRRPAFTGRWRMRPSNGRAKSGSLRIALGATPRQATRIAEPVNGLRYAARHMIGLAGSFGLSARALSSLLFGIARG